MSFVDQARLVARVLPYIRRRQDFALKVGTVINLFFRGLPRFSVHIDLGFLPVNPYEEALESIYQQLNTVAEDIRADEGSGTRIIAPGQAST